MINLIKRIKGKGLKTRMCNPYDEFFDQLIGVRTFGFKHMFDDWADPKLKSHYMPVPYRIAFGLFRAARLSKSDVVIDFGSGLGRAVFAAAHLGAQQAVGVEFDEELFYKARLNKRKTNYAHQVNFFQCDAAEFEIPMNANMFFFYNPFGPETMHRVIENIEKSLHYYPRKATIIYYNPLFDARLKSSKQFSMIKNWKVFPNTGLRKRYAAQIWKN